ncbi:RNA-binding domain-containing protein [Piedraia hortae CBS 480.64]|uniref:RNA-binding domain-containing protein n=1 Tax=Piedraia hortae CBS 480.64 TaxID=1314780 RepID=A0A6A7BRN7_9PEZI|nr:RNA-binding domain-containing protein [Piedraia hortae CBS 480.64]
MSYNRSYSRGRSPPRGYHTNGDRDPSEGRHYSRSPQNSPPPLSNKIVIEKLTKNVSLQHLREIFSPYGKITDLELPLNNQFMMNKGIAYVLYSAPEEAESAIAHMHEAQVDGAQINVSIVLPRRRFSRSPPPKRPPPNRFGEPHRMRNSFGPGLRGRGMGDAFGRGHGRGRMGHGRTPSRYDRYDDRNSYRPRGYSRSPAARGRRSPSFDNRSRSPDFRDRPPPRRRDYSSPRSRGPGSARGYGKSGGGGGGDGYGRRSPSYDSYDSRDDGRERDHRRHW